MTPGGRSGERRWRRGDVRAMRLALRAAGRGPAVDPNPRVGAVILDDQGDVAGIGHHRGSGTPHAEVAALAAAGDRARGGTAYVTLEPCDHVGRTGPCSRALVEAGIARVVYAQPDPNPAAAGGANTLRGSGIAVEEGLFAADARALNVTWTRAMELGRPVITWKYAATLDGRSAAADGTSQWITGAPARADVHERRAGCGAIVVGTGTALADDPRLTVRDAGGNLRGRQPLRVVVGLRDLPADAHLRDEQAPTLQLRTRDPHAVVAALHERGIRHAWLEGGPTLAAAFLRAGLVDEVLGDASEELRPEVREGEFSALRTGARGVDVVGVRIVAQRGAGGEPGRAGLPARPPGVHRADRARRAPERGPEQCRDPRRAGRPGS